MVVYAGYTLFRDTKAARPAAAVAEPAAEPPEEGQAEAPSPEQRAFSRLTRGVHW